MAEWIKNVDQEMVDWRNASDGAKVHKGFVDIFRTLRVHGQYGRIEGVCTYLGEESAIFVGHSLGSALSTILAIACADDDPVKGARLELITLASPRVGNGAFARRTDLLKRHVRVFNGPDAVTWVPTEWEGESYADAGGPSDALGYSSALHNRFVYNGLSDSDQIKCFHDPDVYLWFLSRDDELEPPDGC